MTKSQFKREVPWYHRSAKQPLVFTTWLMHVFLFVARWIIGLSLQVKTWVALVSPNQKANYPQPRRTVMRNQEVKFLVTCYSCNFRWQIKLLRLLLYIMRPFPPLSGTWKRLRPNFGGHFLDTPCMIAELWHSNGYII